MKRITFRNNNILEALSSLNIICIDADECVATDADAAKALAIYADYDAEGDIEVEDMTEDEFNELPAGIKSQL